MNQCMIFRVNIMLWDKNHYMLLGIKSKTYFGQFILSNANLWIICICMGVTLQREAWSRYTAGYQIWTFQRLFNDKPTTWCIHVYQYILLLSFLSTYLCTFNNIFAFATYNQQLCEATDDFTSASFSGK